MHDKAPAHRARQAVETADQCGYEILPHPPEFDNVVNSENFNTIRVFQGTSKMWKTWKYSKVLV